MSIGDLSKAGSLGLNVCETETDVLMEAEVVCAIAPTAKEMDNKMENTFFITIELRTAKILFQSFQMPLL